VADFAPESLEKDIDGFLLCPTELYMVEGLIHYFPQRNLSYLKVNVNRKLFQLLRFIIVFHG
jgi:hypothetical protein